MPDTFAPLHYRLFRYFWIVNLISTIGTWMHIVAAAWLMRSLTNSPLFIALLQTALTLPVFFFSLPGGILADLFSLKKFLCFTQLWMALAALSLALMTQWHLVTPWSLLSITFLLGIGTALNIPAMQTAIATMVPHDDLREASTLNSISFSAARVIGPAVGGFLIAGSGPFSVFILNAASFLGVISFFLWLYPTPKKENSSTLPLKNSLTGFSTILSHPSFKNILKKTFLFFFCTSAVWALSPIIAEFQLGKGIKSYTNFVTCLGLGAVGGGLGLATLRNLFSDEKLTSLVFMLFSLLIGLLSLMKNHLIIYSLLVLIGFSWITIASTFAATVLRTFSNQLKSRAFSLYWVVLNGGVALGSALWGKLATKSHWHTSLLACSSLAFIGALLFLKWNKQEALERFK